MRSSVLSPAERELVCCGPEPDAESLLASVLRSGQLEKAEMGELALDLFQSARYSLATMLFAHWTGLEPENPEPWSNLGLCLLRQNRIDDARQVLEYATSLNQRFFPALSSLCDVYGELGLTDLQLASAEKCVELQPDFAIAHNNLGSALWQAGRIDEAKIAFAACLRLDPGYFEAKFNVARIAADEGDHVFATAFFEEMLTKPGLDPRRREVIEHHLSFEYLNAGRLAAGWDLYERGFSPLVPPSLARRPDRRFNVPRWEGQPLSAGQTLLLWREQGIGDELRFLSLLPELNVGQGKIVLETDPRLVSMLQRSFPQYSVRAYHPDQASASDGLQCEFDYQLPVGSLPRLLLRDRSIYSQLGGYLKSSPWQAGRFAQRLARNEGRRLVGICWRSHKLTATRNRKYTSLSDWDEVLSRPDLTFVNLQYGDCEDELVQAEKRLGIEIVRWPDVNLKDDLEAVLGIMQNLDLVISTSTAVLPMAGAAGRPALFLGHQSWMLLGETTCYPWFATVMPLVAADTEPVSAVMPEVLAAIDLQMGRTRSAT